MKKSAVMLMLLALLLSGCCSVNEETPGSPRLVTGVSASYQSGTIQLRREYTDGEKMRGILDYFRLVKTLGPPETDPETVEGNRICVTVHYSDGTQRTYDQWADQFLRWDGGPWQRIQPEKAQELALLLGLTESD